MFTIPNVEFPVGIEPIFECAAEGICDEVLEVLDEADNNNQKDGLVVFRSGHMGSYASYNEGLKRAMPKNGAAMVLIPSDPGRGHIETLAQERGVVLLFEDEELRAGPAEEVRKNTRQRLLEASVDWRSERNNFSGHKKVRIVSNGKIARIYPVQEV
jgi:hypothetical protein